MVWILILGLVLIWYFVRFDGLFRATSNAREIFLVEVPAGSARPVLVESEAEPNSVFIVLDHPPGPDGLFDALRINTVTGERGWDRVPLGGQAGYSVFRPATVTAGFIRVEFRGLFLRRPMFHLFRFPAEGKGAGVHLEDSYTGMVRVIAESGRDRQALLFRWVFNSNRVPEVEELASLDTKGRVIACLWPSSRGWTLWLFPRTPLASTQEGMDPFRRVSLFLSNVEKV